MEHRTTISKTARRVTAVIVAASVAGLIATTAAFAASSSGAAQRRTPGAPHRPGPRLHRGGPRRWAAVSQGICAAWSDSPRPEFTKLELAGLQLGAASLGSPPSTVETIDARSSPASSDYAVSALTLALEPVRLAQHHSGNTVMSPATTVLACDPTPSPRSSCGTDPPGQRGATQTAAFDLQACSHAGPIYLGVEPTQPGVGTING